MAAIASLELKTRLFQLFKENHTIPLKDIIPRLSPFKKGEINKQLYDFANNGVVERVNESPPIWRLCEAGGSSQSQRITRSRRSYAQDDGYSYSSHMDCKEITQSPHVEASESDIEDLIITYLKKQTQELKAGVIARAIGISNVKKVSAILHGLKKHNIVKTGRQDKAATFIINWNVVQKDDDNENSMPALELSSVEEGPEDMTETQDGGQEVSMEDEELKHDSNASDDVSCAVAQASENDNENTNELLGNQDTEYSENNEQSDSGGTGSVINKHSQSLATGKSMERGNKETYVANKQKPPIPMEHDASETPSNYSDDNQMTQDSFNTEADFDELNDAIKNAVTDHQDDPSFMIDIQPTDVSLQEGTDGRGIKRELDEGEGSDITSMSDSGPEKRVNVFYPNMTPTESYTEMDFEESHNPGNPDTRDKILACLYATPNGRLVVKEISKRIGVQTKKEVNPDLYALQRNGLVKKVQESPPVWELTSEGREVASQCNPLPKKSYFSRPTAQEPQERFVNHTNSQGLPISPAELIKHRHNWGHGSSSTSSSQGGFHSGSSTNQGGFPSGSSTNQGGFPSGSSNNQGGFPSGSSTNQGGFPSGSGTSEVGFKRPQPPDQGNHKPLAPNLMSLRITPAGILPATGRPLLQGVGRGQPMEPVPHAEVLSKLGRGYVTTSVSAHPGRVNSGPTQPSQNNLNDIPTPQGVSQERPSFGSLPGSYPRNSAAQTQGNLPGSYSGNSAQPQPAVPKPQGSGFLPLTGKTGGPPPSPLELIKSNTIFGANAPVASGGPRKVNAPSFGPLQVSPASSPVTHCASNPFLASIARIQQSETPKPPMTMFSGGSISNVQFTATSMPGTLESGRIPPVDLSAISSDSFAALNKNPISALMEYAQSRKLTATTEVLGQTGPSHMPKFRIAAKVGNRMFPEVVARNKKDGRREAADLALRTLISEGQYQAAQSSKTNIVDKVQKLGLRITFFDRVAAMSHHAFNTLAAMVPESMSGRKVLAAMIMKRSPTDEGQVISVGTGNRCIEGIYLSLEGKTVNDSHAEIITRRGFLRFVYQNLLNHEPGSEDSIFDSRQSGQRKLSVRPDVSFHLYISTAPCGDGALFSPTDVDNSPMSVDENASHDPIFTSQIQGILRTKMERGEGTIPIEAGFKGQTWDGILRGERLRTMSCSDKICRWNLLGMQGALLTNFMEPVYLSSITLGYLYVHGHLSRAVCCRLENNEPDISHDLPPGYHINHPKLGRVTAYDPPRETEKTTSVSLNWVMGDKRPEVTDGTKGCLDAKMQDARVSQVSKIRMYALFKQLCQHYNRTDLLDVSSYHQAKMAARDFQQAKAVMYQKFKKAYKSTWVSKPAEEEMFAV